MSSFSRCKIRSQFHHGRHQVLPSAPLGLSRPIFVRSSSTFPSPSLMAELIIPLRKAVEPVARDVDVLLHLSTD